MKRSKRTASVVCVTCASLLAAIAFWLSGDAAGEVLRPDGDPSGLKAPKSGVANAELSVSIFNDKLRRFKFRLEHTGVVTVEEAAAFMERYSSRDNPAIIGAYADPDANLLVVIGPPEAEQAIRNDLATAIIELQGIPGIPGNGNLKIQKRTLQSQGRELIRDLAGIELVRVKLAHTKDENRDQSIKRLNSQMQALRKEVSVIEQQIEVLDKYLKRLDKQPFGTAKETTAR